jgi:ferredoxin
MGHYHQESFGAASIAQNVRQQAEERAAGDGIEGVAVDFLGSGRKAPCEPGQTVLQAARAAGVRIPAACESGICGTCKVLKRDGEVDMRHNGGISNEDIAAGFILACCSRPLRDVAVEA